MRKCYGLNDGWKICSVKQKNGLLDAQRLSRGDTGEVSEIVWYGSTVPTSVQDILCRNGVVPEKARSGTEDLAWIAEKDWI